MKKWIIGLLVLSVLPLGAKTLPLSRQTKEEASVYMYFLQAVQAELRGEENRACAYYERALRLAPENKYLRRNLLVCALGQEQTEKAALYADYIDMGENDGEDLAVYAFYKWRTGDFKQARTYYEQALAKSPDDMRTLYQYVLLLTYLDVDLAVEKLQEYKAAYPGMGHVIDYEIGNIYGKRKQWDKAVEYYNLATRQKPDYAEPYLARAEIYEKNSRFFLMLRELELLEATGYESAGMYSRMGSVFVLVKDDEKARSCFQKAKALDPADIPAGYFLALYAERDGDFVASARLLRETSDFQTDAGKWVQVSFYEQRAGDDRAALATLKEAYKRFDKNVEVGYFYGLMLQDAKQYRRAARVLKGVLRTNPQYENARLAYAYALESLGKYKEMEAQVLLVLEQNPKNAAACNLLGFSLADRGVRLEEAREYISRALALDPEDRSFIDSMAWVQYRQGRYAEALDLLEALDAEFIAANPDAAWHLGAVYAALGRTEEAEKYLRSVAAQNKEAAKLLRSLHR